MSSVDDKLLKRNEEIEAELDDVVRRYKAMRDARWMFARAHDLITHQINVTLRFNPSAFRNPDQLIRFNISFATAFLAAVADMASPPWRQAFTECALVEAQYNMWIPMSPPSDPRGWRPVAPPLGHSDDANAVKLCAISMANAHIKTDIVNSLKTIGCIDRNDYGNILIFVERGARQAIIELHGRTSGAIFNWLKEALLPLDKMWRNSVYTEICRIPVPNVEQAFIDAVDQAEKKMKNIKPSVH